METGLLMYLGQDANVKAAIGQRVFGSLVPKGAALPAVVLQTITTVQDTYTFANGVNDIRTKRVQVDVYGTTYEESISVSNTVRRALQNVQRITLPNGVAVEGIFIRQERDMNFEDGSGIYVFRHLFEFDVVYHDV